MVGDAAAFAFQCALAALWASVGVRPSVVAGFGAGELAAAHACGVLGLEEGLRLAIARGTLARTRPQGTSAAATQADVEAALAGIEFRPPTIALVSGATGRVAGLEEVLETACGLRQAHEPAPPEWRCLHTLAERGVTVVVEIGPHGSVGPMVVSGWPQSAAGTAKAEDGARGPLVLSGPGSADGNGSKASGDTGFVRSVARAYEAGLPVAFAGLHAGETRRRIAVPGYPFQPRRHWIETPQR